MSRAAELAGARLDEVHELKLGETDLAFLGQFDAIVCNDVLEHLYDPWKVLADVRPLLRPNGCVVASIPNIRYYPVFSELIVDADWHYKEDGVMDWTHIRFFTRKSLCRLFESSGYRITRLEGLNATSFGFKWNLINKLTRGRLDDTRYRQFACVASPA